MCAVLTNSSALSQATLAIIESLERRALLSAGSVLHTEFTDVAGHSDTGGAVVRVAEKLLQVGLSFDADFNPVFSLARFNASGTPDTTFNAGSNVITTAFPGDVYAVGAVNAAAFDAASGRIIVVGKADSAGGSDFFVAAFTSNGELDGTFSGDGVSTGGFFAGRPTEARAVAIANDGSVYVAGGATFNEDLFGVAHFNSDGTLDGFFGIAQTPTLEDVDGTDSIDIVHAIALDVGGNIILAGSSLARFNHEDAPVIALQRYLPSGAIDPSFGVGGSVRFDVLAPNVTALGDKAYSVVVDQAGRIVAGGTTDGPIASSDDFVLLRLNDDGTADDSFGSGGVVRTYFGGFTSGLITDMAIQSDGAILAGGNVVTCTDESCGESSNTFAVARYDAEGQLDPEFGGTGVVFTQNFSNGRAENNLATLALQSDADGNQFLALGSWMPINFADDLVLVRLALSGATVSLSGPAGANEGDALLFTANFAGGLAPGITFVQEQHRAEGSVAPTPSTTVNYDWTITLNGSPIAQGSGIATNTLAIPFTPADNGVYHVAISIDGGTDSDSFDITVANVSPTAAITGAPAGGVEGSTITLGSSVTDPGSADTFSHAWTVTKNGSAYAAGSASTFSFTPDDNGSYVVSLTVTDDDGGVGLDSKTILIANVNPTATISGAPTSSPEGTAIALSGTVTDPGSADTFSYAWSLTKNGNAFASGSDTAFGFTPDDNGTYVVTLTVTDDDGGVGIDSQSITVSNVAPNASINGAPASGAEGSGISLTSSVSDAGAADTFSYAWSVTKNGSAYANGSSATFSFTPNDNGTYLVMLTVTDDDGGVGSDSRTISISNVAPTLDPVSGPSSGDQGSPQTFTSFFSDPGSGDSWTLTWNFGDGTTQTTSGAPGTISATHTYLAAGTYSVSVTVGDDDGGSATQSSSITINSNNTGTLQITGTAGNDDISVNPGANGSLLVEVNGVRTTHSGVTKIIITAGAGNDKIKINPDVSQNAVVFAGDGDDSVKTGAGDDIIVGGNGDDLMHGNDGRDILIGGNGRDRIVGNADSDILVAGFSQHDANLTSLQAISAEWTSSRSYGQRTANVVGRDVLINGVLYTFSGPRLNGNNFLTPDGIDATVFDDFAVDLLTGSSGQDLFLFNNDCPIRDILSGVACNEFAADIDFLSEP